MNRRGFIETIGSLFAGAFVANVAALYSPGRPWDVALDRAALALAGTFYPNETAFRFFDAERRSRPPA